MVITLDNNVFAALKAKFAGKYTTSDYVMATTAEGNDTIGLPLPVTAIEYVADQEEPFIVVSYKNAERGDDVNEVSAERCEDLAAAIELMVYNVEHNNALAYSEICVDDGYSIYDVMRWKK